jgi:class 3 adenylate cyclase
MTLADEINNSISDIMTKYWNVRDANTVPSDSDLSLTGNVVRIQGTVLYADMKESSELVNDVNQPVAGRVIQSYLRSIARLITDSGGTITAYDGDRIMGIFVGTNKNTSAAICALKINYVVSYILKPKLTNHFKSINTSGFVISHCTGIDTGNILAVKAGQCNANDIVWIGRPPNLAAKLSEIRNNGYNSFISSEVYSALNDSAKLGGEKNEPIWNMFTHDYLGKPLMVYGSHWWHST